jgi:hypothetical protein
MMVDQLDACDYVYLAASLRATATGLLGVSRFIEDRRWFQTVLGGTRAFQFAKPTVFLQS